MTQFIDLFRATAALWVLVAHCMIWGGWYWQPLPSAKFAVDLFMMISGFLMAVNSARGPLSDPTNRLRFWLRRFFRLAPAYYAALLLAVLSQSYFRGGYENLQAMNPGHWIGAGIADEPRFDYTVQNIAMHVSFAFGLTPQYASTTLLPDWSLGLEMQFYLAFPAILLAMQAFGFVRTAIALTLISLLATQWVTTNYHFTEPSLLPFKLMHFLAGILVWRALAKRDALMALLAIILVCVDPIHHRSSAVLPALCAGMLALGWVEQSGQMPAWLRSVIQSRAVKFGSDTSYGVYLFHGFLIAGGGWLLGGFNAAERSTIMLCTVVPLAYLVGYGVHRWIEQPGIRLGRTVIGRIGPMPISAKPSP